jgi:hypothetical protein
MIYVRLPGSRRLMNCPARFVLVEQCQIIQLDNTAKTGTKTIQYP